MTRRALTAAGFASCLWAADETGSLAGLIAGETGQPVPDALVKAQHTVRQNTYTATSGRDGRYRLDGLPAGSYNLYVSRRGYCAMWIRQVIVRPGESATRNVTLAQDTACQPGKRGK